MRHSISVLLIVTAIALAGCTAGNSRTGGIETLPSVPEERYTPTATSSFPGEAAHLIDETSSAPVTVRAEPSVQARSVISVGKEEVVQVVDSTRDQQQGMWYLVQHASGQEGWVMGQFVRFTGNPDLSARPSVVMRGGGPILAQPGNDARVVGQVRGGEVLTISRSVEVPELDNRKSTWLQTDRGWVSAEFMFQPACLRFNGNLMRVVSVEGAIVRTEPSNQAKEVDRLEGGETVVPLAVKTNEQGEWLKNEQGWVDSKTLFLPACQNPTS
ncbi:MAG TPA: SH3 domain-containing protein [Crinalium sp.]|jgi:hypothetical protein